AGWQNSGGTIVMFGGDAMSHDTAVSLMEVAPRMVNLYGPTETTVWSSMYLCPKRSEQSRGGPAVLPVGRPILNTQIVVASSQLEPLPVGGIGEIYIGGEGLARGYWNRPEL